MAFFWWPHMKWLYLKRITCNYRSIWLRWSDHTLNDLLLTDRLWTLIGRKLKIMNELSLRWCLVSKQFQMSPSYYCCHIVIQFRLLTIDTWMCIYVDTKVKFMGYCSIRILVFSIPNKQMEKILIEKRIMIVKTD